MDIINTLEISSDIIYDDRASALFVIKPEKLDDLPSIDPSLINNKYITVETHETVSEYFNEVLSGKGEIVTINGLHLSCWNDAYYCDYCRMSIRDNWFYCNHCNSDMCKLCKEETSEEIAIQNGAKNYKAREEALNKCFECNKIEPRNTYYITQPIEDKYCDLCSTTIKVDDNHYSGKYEHHHTFDICIKCYETKDEAKTHIKEKNMHMVDPADKKNYLFYYTGLGSMLYWVPILSDGQMCSVLMNLNPDDVNYGKLCLKGCDDHERHGLFIINNDNYNLQMVLQKLKEICDKGTYEYEEMETIEEAVYGDEVKTIDHGDGWFSNERELLKPPKYQTVTKTAELCASPHYLSPIHLLMAELNMPIYYG